MGRPRNSQMMVAREACVVVVGARPVEYAKITVTHNRTGEQITIDNQNNVVDSGSEGIPYVFRAFQKVSSNHPAVKDSPSSFMPLDEVDEVDRELVKS
jgi:dihydroxyacetone kinase-like predicted kinase